MPAQERDPLGQEQPAATLVVMNTLIPVIGWTATVIGVIRLLPQARTIKHSSSVHGVSTWSVAITVLSMIWWILYCAAIADPPSTVSSVGSFIAPCICLWFLRRHGRVQSAHYLFIALGAVVGAGALSLDVELVGLLASGSTMAHSVPQFVRLLRTSDASGLSEGSWALTTLNAVLWAIYGHYINSLPLILPILVTVPTALLVALTMERFGTADSCDGVLIGPRRRSFTFPAGDRRAL